MLIVSKNLEISHQLEIDFENNLPENVTIIADTEFTQKSKMTVDIIGLNSSLNSELTFTYFYEDLTEDFNPVTKIFEAYGYSIKSISEDELVEGLANDLGLLQEQLFGDENNSKALKSAFYSALESGYFDSLLEQYNLSRDCLKYKRERKESYIYLEFPKINIKFEFFFASADIFKIWGKSHQDLILQAQLNQFRVLKLSKPISIYVYINNKLYELSVIFSDSFYRIPPLSDKSLNGNAKALGLTESKIDIKSDNIALELGLTSGNDVMSNFSKLREQNPMLAAKYNAQDIFLSNEVSQTQQKLLNKLREDFDIQYRNIEDTTGSNVSKFIIDLIFSKFGICADDKENLKLIRELLNLSKIGNLQTIPLNDFGIQPFLTVGGLLYSRCAKHPKIEGKLGDCDLQSCYATFMSSMNIYIGEPVTRTFRYQKYKPTFKEIIDFLESQNIPRDAWFVRVSGELKQAYNTLILSDLRFVPKSILNPTVNDLNPDKKSVEKFNAYKTPKKQAVSTLLLKEVKFGLINADLLDCLRLLPDEWYQEYLDLKCDCLVYFPSELIAENLTDVSELRSNLPDESYTETFNPKNGVKNIQTQYYQNNVALKFNIGEYWNVLKSKRAEYKKAKNPIQEIFKLVGNSGYGVLACLNLATNNLVASNQITAGARSACWLMVNALNGFAPITDGTSFSWDSIPLGLKFKDVLKTNPSYLFDYDSNIKSNLSFDDVQTWFDGVVLNDKFKQHIYDFYGIDKLHIPANKFGFELKEETFFTKSNEPIKTVFFTTYLNTNAGNYSKGLNDCELLIDATDYDFNEQNNYVKARSFDGKNNDLIQWYLDSINDKYESPIIYSENKIMKFGDGNAMAIRLLESENCSHIAHPMGFSTKGFKMMKLISRSQFLFLNESQLKNFETNETKLAELSNHLFTKSFWSNLSNEDLKMYDCELIDGIDYYKFSRSHSVGVGFELLALAKSKKGCLQVIRQDIFDKIMSGCENFNAGLNISRNYKLADKFKYLLAAIIVKKANAEYELIQCLQESAKEPTILSLKSDNVKTLKKLWEVTESD